MYLALFTRCSFLANRTPVLGRNQVYTKTKLVTLPDWLAPGNAYFLGAIIDPDDQIPEVDDNNNASSVAIEVQ